MQYYTYAERDEYPLCILVNNIDPEVIRKEYLAPFGIDADSVMILSLHKAKGKKKTPAKEIKQYISEEITPVLKDYNVKYTVVGDADYFKIIAGLPKADMMIGYVSPSAYGSDQVAYVPNYQGIFYNPELTRKKIETSMRAVRDHFLGQYQQPGKDVIKFAAYPTSTLEIANWLTKLKAMKRPLTVDIEGYSLKPYSAGIATISFAWNQGEGIAFPVDLSDNPALVRQLLRDFFESFEYPLIYHHIAFDVTVLIYQLYMKSIDDTEGLLFGLDVMLRNWHDTRLITYLATNSCAGNKLGLKEQAQEFAGNYALEDIKDITKVPFDKLLEYNLVDALATWYVHDKHWQTLVDDDQLRIYRTIFKPAMVEIVQMQLTGLPIDLDRVDEVEVILQHDNDVAFNNMLKSSVMEEYMYLLKEQWIIKQNEKLKVLRRTMADADKKVKFNPNSGDQLITLLYTHLGLPVIAKTDSGLAATGGKVLKALKSYTQDPAVLDFLDLLIAYKAVNKILTGFIPAFKKARQGKDGWHYLLGNFNLGGTLSGRLSSSDPNLQNLPATGSKYAKLIKSCFLAPPGWLFCGIDFNALEDRISALTTRDPQKLKVYTDGYDGHCLRAFGYFGNQMPDIDPNSVESINSIADKYKPLRQDSKVPTFLLTYGGTFKGIMEQCGFDEVKAKSIEKNYHILYQVSDAWVASHIEQATKTGYVTVAFGLRVRTPLLKQIVYKSGKVPYEAEAEGRSAGNALGQSWCLLNSRAGSEFMGKVRKSKFRLDIRPCAQIHDAQYFLIRDDLEVLKYANDNVVQACEWQDDPLIYHDEVKLGGTFTVFYPTWAEECDIPNGAEIIDFQEKMAEHLEKLEKKKAT